MFLDNKYTNWYNSIINNAKSQARSRKHGYYEKHHIMPKSLGGLDDKENLVLLTAREHYMCHLLLIRMLQGEAKAKMIFACLKLSGGTWFLPEGVVRSRSYESLRLLAGAASSERLKGRTKSESHKLKLKESFSKSESYQTAIRANRLSAQEKNKGRKRPRHSKLMHEMHLQIHNEQFKWQNKKTGEVFTGSRLQLVDTFHNLRKDELWKVSRGLARSHKGWVLVD